MIEKMQLYCDSSERLLDNVTPSQYSCGTQTFAGCRSEGPNCQYNEDPLYHHASADSIMIGLQNTFLAVI